MKANNYSGSYFELDMWGYFISGGMAVGGKGVVWCKEDRGRR